MLGMVNIMGVDHTIQVRAFIFWHPFYPLMNNDVVENEVKYAVAKDTDTHRK
jgi:hypothetical protein